jgi:hypothetical protein
MKTTQEKNKDSNINTNYSRISSLFIIIVIGESLWFRLERDQEQCGTRLHKINVNRLKCNKKEKFL